MAKRSIYAVLSGAEELYQALHGFHFDGGPGQPGPLAQIIAGGVLREMSGHIRDRRMSEQVGQLARDLVQTGASGLSHASDPDGSPLVNFPFPLPWPPKKFDNHESIYDTLPTGMLDKLMLELAQKIGTIAKPDVRAPRTTA